MDKKYIILLIIVGVLVYIISNTFIKSRDEHKKSYNFIIKKVEVTSTNSLIFFDGSKKVLLWNFVVMKYDEIKVGDLLVKESCSDKLKIYRKQSSGKYKLHLKVASSGMFPIEWFCK